MALSWLRGVFTSVLLLGVSTAGCGVGDSGPIYTSAKAITYSIFGKVNGPSPSGVTIRLSGAATLTATTDNAGNYFFSNISNGSYTITPVLAGYTFSPASLTVTLSGADITSADFAAAINEAPTYGISGTLSGAVQQGVTITLTGAANATTITDANGNYSFTGLADGNYTVTPTLAGYIFNPASTAVTISGSNVTGTNFTATLSAAPTYSFSGKVSGAVLQGVTITLSGAANATTTTDTNGNYSFTGLLSGSYTITPSLNGYVFIDASKTVTLTNANAVNINFAAMAHAGPVFSISGTVSGAAQEGLTIILSGTACATTLTDAGGHYTFTGLAAGSYAVIPETWLTCSYIASPKSADVTVNSADVTGTDFTLAAGNSCGGVGMAVGRHTISGTVSGTAREGVTMILTGPFCSTATTDSIGNYSFNEYFIDATYTVTPALAGHTFDPTSVSIPFMGSNVAGKNFTVY